MIRYAAHRVYILSGHQLLSGQVVELDQYGGYDIQLKYDGKYYFYTIAKKDGEILGWEKLNQVDEFPVKDFPVYVRDK